ncbi:putative glycolipid-binding domain-containing protein [Caballeronia sp. LZ001]|uniref:putative glycolipid-binding domain-containing protein n=1 Tax=Caballeronia sp. LZ001 TaxID=3038553 RepID=UPI0028624A06|nr:putative glycolipid-binding domain-containing protein [Caballeronia sp. LZ001]MDR5801995.1 putative glycolipid-binding domain-containing protein [Caballeronia sp. LZ001]
MKTVRWSQVDGTGLEHLVLDDEASPIVIESVVAGESEAGAFGLVYRIECDARWQVTRLAAKLAGGATLDLHRSDGDDGDEHAWIDADGSARDELRGCIDVDLSATPFTNTLPIRRLKLQRGERRVIRVAYVNVPALTVSAVEQAYTCLEDGRRYRYEGLDTGFTAEIDVDENGLVTAYPGLFKRTA